MTLDEVGGSDFTTLLAGGIVNPMGPTLTVLGLASDGASARQSVVELVLHPFFPRATRVATTEARVSGDQWQDLAAVLGSVAAHSSCPTLLLPSTLLDEERNTQVWSHALSHYADGSITLQRVRSYPGDPWKRVEHEMDSVDLSAPRPASLPLEANEARELALIQLTPANLRAEMEAFMFAWNGSIDFQAKGGSPLASSAMPVDTLAIFLSLIAQTTHLPGIDGR